jgi:hypothetical protein
MGVFTTAEKADSVAALGAANDAQADATQALADAATAAAAAAAKLSPGGNLTGSVGGTAVATVLAALALAASALQPGGTLTGAVAGGATIDGTLASTVKAGAALGATAVQPATSPTLSGLTITGLAGVVKAAAGVLAAATIVNADVSASAAIDGSKIAPNFGAQNIVTTGYLQVGTGASAPTTGDIRIFNNTAGIVARTAAGGADLPLLRTNSGNTTIVGNTVGQTVIDSAPGGHVFAVSGSQVVGLTGSALSITSAAIVWGASATPVISQTLDATATVIGKTMSITAQECSGTTSVTAGKLSFKGGSATGVSGTRIGGSVEVLWGTGATANGNISIGAVAASYQSMSGGLFVGNCSVIPSGNPAAGGFLYVEAGALKYRGPSGAITPLGAA